MGEHVLRYERVARAFTARGFAVYGQDHRGHGASASAVPGDLGPGGWPALVADIGVLTAHVRAEQPGLPVVLLAHSMGSFAAQQYLLDHSDGHGRGDPDRHRRARRAGAGTGRDSSWTGAAQRPLRCSAEHS
jgi:alpha-beta hydrolase superfamily lysophospholipase